MKLKIYKYWKILLAMSKTKQMFLSASLLIALAACKLQHKHNDRHNENHKTERKTEHDAEHDTNTANEFIDFRGQH